MLNTPMTAEDVARRNQIFLRAKHSDSEDDEPCSAPTPPPELLPEDLTFLQSLTQHSFNAEATLTRLTSLIHYKLDLITKRQDAQVALEVALRQFTKGYWRSLMSDQRLANPINDVFKAVLYYSDRKDLAWVGTVAEKLDFTRRMRLVGYELDAISEQHQIEIQMRRTDEKRAKQRKKEDERRARYIPESRRQQEPVQKPMAIPQVDMEAVFGPDVGESGRWREWLEAIAEAVLCRRRLQP